jgi:hypothetical protein
MFNSGFTNKIAYKVIRPYTSQKLHYSSSLEGGASKCYREVKTSMPNSNNFSIMNMTTNEIMDYAMNKLPTQQQNGGIMPTPDMKKLEDRMESIEARIKKIEDQNLIGHHAIDPIGVVGPDGKNEEITAIYYNGVSTINEIIFEDGSSVKLTDNHRLLVNRTGKKLWIKVSDLYEGDDIVEVDDFGQTEIPAL